MGVAGESEGAFKLEYLFYILAVLVIGLICLVTIRFNFKVETNQPPSRFPFLRRPRADAGNETTRGEAVPASAHSARATKPALDRALLHVRTPWGWPMHEERNRVGEPRRGLSARVQSFTDRLLREKDLVSSPSGDPRISGSIRALLEDRYGRVNRQSMAEIEYQKVKPPRLRDPSEPHDQMDNFGTREAERIRQKLKLLTAMNKLPDAVKEPKELRYVELKDIKRPWGW